MSGNDSESVTTGASSKPSRTPTVAKSRSMEARTVTSQSSSVWPNASKGGSVKSKSSAASTKTAGSHHPERVAKFVPPRVMLNGLDVTPPPLSTVLVYNGTLDELSGIGDGVNESQLLSDGMIIPWIVAAGAERHVVSTTPFMNNGNEVGFIQSSSMGTKSNSERHASSSKFKRSQAAKQSAPRPTDTVGETPTMEIFQLAGSAVREADEGSKCIELRARIAKSASNEGMPRRDRFVQTFHNTQRTKEATTDPHSTRNIGCYSNLCYNDSGTTDRSISTMPEFNDSLIDNEDIPQILTCAAMTSEGCLIDLHDGKYDISGPPMPPRTFASPQEVKAYSKKGIIFRSQSLAKRLRWMERILLQEKFHEQQLYYRGRPIGSEAEIIPFGPGRVSKPSKPISLDHLFTFSCAFCNGKTVTSMEWNRTHEDILAVGYKLNSLPSENVAKGGMVLLWSLRNPTFPEKTIFLDSSVTCLAFSPTNPFMLAVGTEGGNLFIFDITAPHQELLHPIFDSVDALCKHNCAIWELKWILKKASAEGHPVKSKRATHECLVSVGSDGRVLEWATEKGLAVSCTLMTFNHADPHIGRICHTAAALCIDFLSSCGSRQDSDPHNSAPTSYLVGTEDGCIHRCSYTYMEQPLETHSGHAGPVYHIRCSPLLPNTFLSCSADWSVKVWSTNGSSNKSSTGMVSFSEEHVFRSLDLWDAVNDVAWSHTSSTVFASVTDDGRIQLYDLSKSASDPVLTQYCTSDPATNEVSVQVQSKVHGDDFANREFEVVGGANTSVFGLGDANTLTSEVTQSPTLTCLCFNRKSPVLVVGDTNGNVFVYNYRLS